MRWLLGIRLLVRIELRTHIRWTQFDEKTLQAFRSTYIPDPDYKSDDPFAELVLSKAKASELSAIRGRLKKRRIRKATEGRPKRQVRCGHCN